MGLDRERVGFGRGRADRVGLETAGGGVKACIAHTTFPSLAHTCRFVLIHFS